MSTDNLFIQWECENIIDQFKSRKTNDGFNLRVFKARKEIALDRLADKVIAVMALEFSNSKALSAFIMLLLILSISPFKFKFMLGEGIDSIIDSLKKDEEEGYMYITKKILEEELYKSNLSIKSMDWFLENNLFEQKDEKYIFRGGKIKSAKLYQDLD